MQLRGLYKYISSREDSKARWLGAVVKVKLAHYGFPTHESLKVEEALAP
jgi:hypothetical protein